jgi:hypothetical protein
MWGSGGGRSGGEERLTVTGCDPRRTGTCCARQECMVWVSTAQ